MEDYSMRCLECGKRAPHGFALCDECATKVYRNLAELLKKARAPEHRASIAPQPGQEGESR